MELRAESGDVFSLMPRHVDYNLPKTLTSLRMVDEAAGSVFEKLVFNPVAFGKLSPVLAGLVDPLLDENLRNNICSKNKALLFSPSKREAFEHMCSNSLTLLWGPPSTGKPHSLALACFHMIEMQFRARRETPFRILITAFTHTAISAFLDKFNTLLERGKTGVGGVKPLGQWVYDKELFEQMELQSQQTMHEKQRLRQYSLTCATVVRV